jgi:transcription elongation factor Elf1
VLIDHLGPNCETIEAMKRVTCGHCGRRAETWREHGGMPITQYMKKLDA